MEQFQRLRSRYCWMWGRLKINGDAIYGTRPWKVYGEGPTKITAGFFHDADTKPYTAEDFRFTTKSGAIYAIEMGWPTGHEATIHSLSNSSAEKVDSVYSLSAGNSLQFQQQPDGLHIQLPDQPQGKYAYAYRITTGTSSK